jgi:hypothetical protein
MGAHRLGLAHLGRMGHLRAGLFLLGLTMGSTNANEMGYSQSITPDHMQGRTNAARRSTNRAMIVIGAPWEDYSPTRSVSARCSLQPPPVLGWSRSASHSARTDTPASTTHHTRPGSWPPRNTAAPADRRVGRAPGQGSAYGTTSDATRQRLSPTGAPVGGSDCGRLRLLVVVSVSLSSQSYTRYV